MSPTSWFGISGLSLPLLVALVVALLYLLRPPPPTIVVPSVLLWRPIAERRRSHTLLRRLLSALLSLLVALGLAFALAGPPRPERRGAPQILVVDNSATMATEVAPGVTRLDRALEQARELVSDWQGPTLLADTTGGSGPRWAHSDAEAEAWLRGLRTSSARGRLPALHGAIPGSTAAAVRRLLISDGVALASLEDWQVVSVYQPVTNVGLLAFDASSTSPAATTDSIEAFLQVFNASLVGVTSRLVVERAEGQILYQRPLELGPRETWSGVLALPATAGGEIVRARIETADDALSSDDLAAIVPHLQRQILVGTVGDVDGAVGRALRLLPRVTVTALPADSSSLEGPVPDVLVAAGWAPESSPLTPTLLFAPPARAWLPEPTAQAIEAVVWARQPGPRDWGPVAFGDLRRYEPSDVEILLGGTTRSADDVRSTDTEWPLVFQLQGLEPPVLVAAFSVEASSIGRHEAFPVLVAELVDRLAEAGATEAGRSQPPGHVLGRRLSDVNASRLPVAPRLEATPSYLVSAQPPRDVREDLREQSRRHQRFAIAMLAVAALLATLETWTRAWGLTE
ncbi:MAG TPA: BatA domain-containing protein [Thermoanaerobaculia bacterium]|nr:BatA domain-containing protein [Thermoanaerobaculia bacterium]